MRVAGIVAEYNPFHSGHRWQIEETRRLGATHVVAVMSGCFVQRGQPAMWDKWVRTRAALAGGADLVLELPLPYACATAERFACGAISILDSLRVVDDLSFGCECGNADRLWQVVEALEHPGVEEALREILAAGAGYATARQQAVAQQCGQEVASLLGEPNNILAIEYMRRLKKLHSPIVPMAILRRGEGHDSPVLGQYASASAIRGLFEHGTYKHATAYLPENPGLLYCDAWNRGEGLEHAQLDRPMLAALRRMTAAEFLKLPDVAEGLENRIYEAVRTAETLDGLLSAIKTKRYSHARLRRILLAGWLGISGELCKQPPPYVRLLGMNDRGKEILGLVGEQGTLPISHSMARLAELGEAARRFVQLEATADDLYGVITKKVQPCGRDYTNSIIVLKNTY